MAGVSYYSPGGRFASCGGSTAEGVWKGHCLGGREERFGGGKVWGISEVAVLLEVSGSPAPLRGYIFISSNYFSKFPPYMCSYILQCTDPHSPKLQIRLKEVQNRDVVSMHVRAAIPATANDLQFIWNSSHTQLRGIFGTFLLARACCQETCTWVSCLCSLRDNRRSSYRPNTHTSGKFPAKIPLQQSSVSTFLRFSQHHAAEMKVELAVVGPFWRSSVPSSYQ